MSFRFTNRHEKVPLQDVTSCFPKIQVQNLTILREDLLHPEISGNKFRKLKYNLLAAKKTGHRKLLTFGGAYSNHIAATAAAGQEFGFDTIGIIRGEELEKSTILNSTLSFAKAKGMHLKFVSRDDYRMKQTTSFVATLHDEFGDFYLLPEGGSNPLAVKGCQEILNDTTASFDVICVSVGTGGTMAGIMAAKLPHQSVIGFSALKGTFQKELITRYVPDEHCHIIDNYAFGGYAKIDLDLIRFINDFKTRTDIPLDPIYTGKMFYGIFRMIEENKFRENSRILAVHTGGIQGIAGMNQRLLKLNLPQIET